MASKRHKRWKECSRKRVYDATGAVAAVNSLRKSGEVNIGAYRCSFCGNWHVGHRPYKVRQKIQARRGRGRI